MENSSLLDLSLSDVDPNDPLFQPMLNDLQANIIKGHGRNFAYHIFLQLQTSRVEHAKEWISKFSKSFVTSASKLEQGRRMRKKTGADGGPVFTFSISATGYKTLGFSDEQLPVEQKSPENSIVGDDPAFKTGAKGSIVKLGDGDVQTDWEESFRNNVDILIIVADSSPNKAWQLSKDIINETSAFSTFLLNQKGQALRRKITVSDSSSDLISIEHFGYADGISQPLYLKDEIESQSATNSWDDREPLKLVLVSDPNGKTNNSFGSFLVFRKLEQNVAEFMRVEETVLPQVRDKDGNINKDLPGAMMVGRFRNGNVLVNSNGFTGDPGKQWQLTNDFDYSNDDSPTDDASYSSKCPFFAHTRITNPRHDVKIAPPTFVHAIRLTRRSIPYQDVNRFGPGQKDLIEVTEEQLNSSRPSEGVGLLFMSYQAHIGKQFEFIQNNWCNHGHIAGHSIGQDGVVGQISPVPKTGLPFKPLSPDPLNKKMPEQWGVDVPTNALDIEFGNFVKNRGGEYFFTPSISFLISLSSKSE